MARRWFFVVASVVIVLTTVVALAMGTTKGPIVPFTCGGYVLPNGKCVGIPVPGAPGATCVPQPQGPCSWFWESLYPTF